MATYLLAQCLVLLRDRSVPVLPAAFGDPPYRSTQAAPARADRASGNQDMLSPDRGAAAASEGSFELDLV
ncbi:MAG: hypothetical protein JXQ73_11960, partial [Phycisphaerae bacterium]|nr:hypothetical protein [Phycisphaerae bacterium]